MEQKNILNIDDYIAMHGGAVRERLMALRAEAHAAAPDAQERIAYGMPAFYVCGKPLAYFAAHKNHIGLYPLPASVETFLPQLSAYKHSKGCIQFPHSEPFPLDLISKILRSRAQACKEQINEKLNCIKYSQWEF